jgi:hypothetical protein
MADLTPSISDGKTLIESDQPSRAHNDDADLFVDGNYTHESRVLSATEFNEICSMLKYILSALRGGATDGDKIGLIEGSDATLDRFSIIPGSLLTSDLNASNSPTVGAVLSVDPSDATRFRFISTPTGPTGPTITGPTGPYVTGPTGTTGPVQTGPTGAEVTGPTGAEVTGPTGAEVTGPTGAQVTGPTGPEGQTGPTGPEE